MISREILRFIGPVKGVFRYTTELEDGGLYMSPDQRELLWVAVQAQRQLAMKEGERLIAQAVNVDPSSRLHVVLQKHHETLKKLDPWVARESLGVLLGMTYWLGVVAAQEALHSKEVKKSQARKTWKIDRKLWKDVMATVILSFMAALLILSVIMSAAKLLG